MHLRLNAQVPGVSSFLSKRTSSVHDTGLPIPPMPGETSEERGMLCLKSLQKGTSRSSRSLTFHSRLTRQRCAQERAKDELQSSEGATMSAQSLTAKPSFHLRKPAVRLSGRKKRLTTCSGKACPDGQRTEQQALLTGEPRVTTTTVGMW